MEIREAITRELNLLTEKYLEHGLDENESQAMFFLAGEMLSHCDGAAYNDDHTLLGLSPASSVLMVVCSNRMLEVITSRPLWVV